MKIAMIGTKGNPADAGGAEKHVQELSIRLVERGHEVTVYCRSTYATGNRTEFMGIKLKTIKTINNKNLDAIVYTFKATIDALKNDFDVYHYHSIGPASLSLIPKLMGKKVVVTVHGLDWQRAKWGFIARLYLRLGEFITGKFSGMVISVSSNLAEYFIEKYKRDKETVFFIPNGVNIYNLQQPEEINSMNITPGNYILFLARLVPEKGAHYLIEAYKRLNTDKKLVIAGGSSFSDNYVESLKTMASGNDNIIFTGSVKGDLLKELYSNCYLYVLPSDIEGMPLTLLEAMSYGKWCLVSNIEENQVVISNGEFGNSFEKSNVDDLTSKLDFELNNKEINQKSEEIMEYVKENYDWESVTEKTVEVYNKILEIENSEETEGVI